MIRTDDDSLNRTCSPEISYERVRVFSIYDAAFQSMKSPSGICGGKEGTLDYHAAVIPKCQTIHPGSTIGPRTQRVVQRTLYCSRGGRPAGCSRYVARSWKG